MSFNRSQSPKRSVKKRVVPEEARMETIEDYPGIFIGDGQRNNRFVGRHNLAEVESLGALDDERHREGNRLRFASEGSIH